MKSEGAFSKKKNLPKGPEETSLHFFILLLEFSRLEMNFVMSFADYFKGQKYEYSKMLIWLLTALAMTKLNFL